MKKITLFAVVLVAISFASCRKTHVCKCTDSSGYSSSFTLGIQTSAQAKASCDSYGGNGTTCTIQ